MSTVVLYIQFRVFWQKLVWFYVNCMSSWADQMIKGPLFLLTSFYHPPPTHTTDEFPSKLCKY